MNDISGIKESDTGLAAPSRWDLVSDKQAMQEEQPLQVMVVCFNFVFQLHWCQQCSVCNVILQHNASSSKATPE